MQKFQAILKKIGWLPISISLSALIIIIIVSHLGTDTTVHTGIWGTFVGAFSNAIIGLSDILGGGYGVGIIVFTILIRLFLLPLGVYQVESMTKMQQLQPQLKALQAEYPEKDADSRQALMAAQQALYKSVGVNPFASMLPLLAQMPVFLGLYQGIASSATLRSGHFLCWELGSRDLWFVLPVLAAACVFLSSWLSSKMTTDATGMTKIMPIVTTVAIFITTLVSPNAMGLYMVMTNIFQVGQTLILQNPFKVQRDMAAKTAREKARRRQMAKLRQQNKKH